LADLEQAHPRLASNHKHLDTHVFQLGLLEKQGQVDRIFLPN
jgi:hypothetical protein